MRFLPRRRLLRRLDAEQTSGSGDLRALLVDLGRELGGGAGLTTWPVAVSR